MGPVIEDVLIGSSSIVTDCN